MRRYRLDAGKISNLKIQTFELPALQAGEVRVSVKAIGLNFADIFAIWGLYKAAPKTDFTPGLEYAGVIESVGEGVSQYRPGDRVMGITRFGAYTTHLNIDARYVIPLPADWDFATGASYLVQTLTAYYGMAYLGNLQKGFNVLIHSAAGGVGLQAAKIARAYGCFAIGTVGTPSKVETALQAGYDKAIVRSKDFKEHLRAALDGRPLHLVLDSIGGEYFTIPFYMLAPMGRMVVFGSARYTTPGDKPNKWHMLKEWLTRPKVDAQSLPEKNRAVLGFNLIWLYQQAALMHQLLQELDALQLTPPHVGQRFSFEKLPEAVQALQSGKSVGKVVVEVD